MKSTKQKRFGESSRIILTQRYGRKFVANLEKRAGIRFLIAIAKSPTMLLVFDRIVQEKIKIVFLNQYLFADSNPVSKTIFIGKKAPISYKLVSIAHEFVHIAVRPTPDPFCSGMNEQEFVDECLEEEVESILAEQPVIAELQSAGYKVDSATLQWKAILDEYGREKIKETVALSCPSSSFNETYVDFYGRWYRLIMKAHRLLHWDDTAMAKLARQALQEQYCVIDSEHCPYSCGSCKGRF